MVKGTQQLLIRGRIVTWQPRLLSTLQEWFQQLDSEGIYSYPHSPQNSAWENQIDLCTSIQMKAGVRILT